MTEKPFGHRAVVRARRTERVGTGALAEHRTVWVNVEIHRRGSLARIKKAARLVRGAEDLLEVESLTQDQYVRAYGNGSETGRYRIV